MRSEARGGWGMEGSVGPFPAATGGTSISILLNLPARWRYPPSSDGKAHPGRDGSSISGWTGLGWAHQEGGRCCNLANDSSSPQLPTCTFLPFPTRNSHYYCYRYYYFSTLLSFAALATVQRAQKGLVEHQGESVSLLHRFSSPKT